MAPTGNFGTDELSCWLTSILEFGLDPSGDSYAFMLDVKWPIIGSIFYLSLKPILRQVQVAFDINPKSPAMNAFVCVHSAILAVFSMVVVWYSWRAVWITVQDHGLWDTYCNIDNKLWDNGMGLCALAFYLSKFYEYVDTMIIILKGKKVSFLQGFHHFVAVLTIWSVAVTKSQGTLWFVCLNSLIHSIMYSYYALAALGYKSPLKRYLTAAQITQFFTGLICCTPVIFIKEGCASWPQKASIIWTEFTAVVLVVLFFNFFCQTYKAKNRGKQLNNTSTTASKKLQ